jgi:hypothetical protein
MTKKSALDDATPPDYEETKPDTEQPAELVDEVNAAPVLTASEFDVASPADGSEAPTTFDPETMRSALDHPQHPLRHLKDA